MPLVLDENQSSTGFFDLFHDSWNAFPSFVIIDHTMTIRAKPWTFENNSNSNSCDGSNGTINGWSGGSTSNFLQQLVDECGDLCINGGCSTSLGDLNEDSILNIQDLITMVNQILGISILDGCPLEAADLNVDGIINIQDLISLVNAILGSGRVSDLNGTVNLEYKVSGSDLIIKLNSDIDISGVQLSIANHNHVDIGLRGNDHISTNIHYTNGLTNFLAFSLYNKPFDSPDAEILIQSAEKLNISDLEILIVDFNGDPLSQIRDSKNRLAPNKFEFSNIYPNPFNPTTEISFNILDDSHITLAAYNVKGEKVSSIFEGYKKAGNYSYNWNASNLASGVYYFRLISGEISISTKALLVK